MSWLNINRNSFFYRLLTFLLLVTLVFYSIINLLFLVIISKMIIGVSKDYMGAIVSKNVAHIDGQLSSISSQGNVLTDLISKDLLNQDQYDEYVQALLSQNPAIHSICLALQSSNPTILSSAIIFRSEQGGFIKKDQTQFYERSWYQVAVLKEQEHWGRPWFDEFGSRQMVFSNSHPIMKKDQCIGVLRMDCLASRSQSDIHLSQLGDVGYLFAISRSGIFVSHPADSLVMNYSIFDLAEEYQDASLRKVGKEMLAGKSDLVKMPRSSYFKNQWIYFAPLESNHWSLGVVADDSFLFGEVRRLQFLLLIVSFLGIVSVTIIIYWRTQKLGRPLKEIAQTAALIGSGDFDAPSVDADNIFEIEQLNKAFETMKASLKEYIGNLQQMHKEKDQHQAELLYATRLQHSLIPPNDLLKDLHNTITFAGLLLPAKNVGGDHYDVFMVDEKRLCFVIADVMGKGFGAAMTMSIVSTYINLATKYLNSSSDILYSLNKFLCDHKLEHSMVTVVLGIMDLSTGMLVYSNCGHIPWYQRKKDMQLIKHEQTQATALGVFPNITIDEKVIRLDYKDQLILMTDGITEAMDAQGKLLGSSGVEAMLKTLQNPNPQMIVATLMEALETHLQDQGNRDDISILVLEYGRPLII